jgi:hypothetical protein
MSILSFNCLKTLLNYPIKLIFFLKKKKKKKPLFFPRATCHYRVWSPETYFNSLISFDCQLFPSEMYVDSKTFLRHGKHLLKRVVDQNFTLIAVVVEFATK